MGICDHNRTIEEAGFLYPRSAGHFTVAIPERPPAGEYGIAHGIFAAGEDGGDAGADWAFANLQFSFARDEGRVADGDAGNVGDGVERAGRAIEGNAQIAGAGLCGRFVLRIDAISEASITPSRNRDTTYPCFFSPEGKRSNLLHCAGS